MFEMDVCSDCFEPSPGYDPEEEEQETEIRHRLLEMATRLITHNEAIDRYAHGRIREIIDGLPTLDAPEPADTDSADTDSTSAPDADDEITESSNSDNEASDPPAASSSSYGPA